MLKKKYKKILIDIISKNIKSCNIYLFGSRAKKTETPHSDIDIAIKAKSSIPLNILSQIREDIEESTIPFFVDIVDMHTASEKLNNEIKKYGIPWKN